MHVVLDAGRPFRRAPFCESSVGCCGRGPWVDRALPELEEVERRQRVENQHLRCTNLRDTQSRHVRYQHQCAARANPTLPRVRMRAPNGSSRGVEVGGGASGSVCEPGG